MKRRGGARSANICLASHGATPRERGYAAQRTGWLGQWIDGENDEAERIAALPWLHRVWEWIAAHWPPWPYPNGRNRA